MKRLLILAAAVCLTVSSFAQTATLTASTDTYSAAGGTVTLTVTVVYPAGGTPSSISMKLDLPAGWTFVSQTLPAEAVDKGSPTAGDDVLEWAFSGFPATQLQWTAIVRYPAALSGTQTIAVDAAESSYYPGGGVLSAPSLSFSARLPEITSATTATCVAGSAFNYTITATESPTSFTASGLPAGLTLNSSTGQITGTPAAGSYSITLQAANAAGTGSSSTLTLAVGALPEITSALTASGMTGKSFSYTVTASNSPTRYAASGLPSGLSINASTGEITGTPSAAGTSSVTIEAENAIGSASATLAITITLDPNAPKPPTITTQPASQSVISGTNVTFTVAASGATSYQWRKDGSAIAGATGSSYTINAVTTAQAGSYSVIAYNGSLSTTSNAAVLTVQAAPAGPPTITTQPAPQSVAVGGSATFIVTATGAQSYQWRRNGNDISGATTATLVVTNCDNTVEGGYSVVTTNTLGSTTSNAVALTVVGVEYFGTFANNAGTFALYIRPDRTGVFLGYLRSSQTAFISKNVILKSDGSFGVAVVPTGPATADDDYGAGGPRVAASASVSIEGGIAADGSLYGTIAAYGLTLSAPAAATAGSTSTLAGFYESGAAGSSATSYTIVGAAGDVYVATVTTTGADAGKGTISATGAIAVTTENSASVSGTVNTDAAISLTTTPPGSTTPTTFTGGNSEQRAPERFINVSTRALAGPGENGLFVGFVVGGSAAKRVLIRGIGPTLKLWVSGAIENPLLTLYRSVDGQSVKITANAVWGDSPDAAAIVEANAKTGAFALPTGSKDSAMLIHLEPGLYSVQLSTTDGTTGIGMVEVYEVQ